MAVPVPILEPETRKVLILFVAVVAVAVQRIIFIVLALVLEIQMAPNVIWDLAYVLGLDVVILRLVLHQVLVIFVAN
jgi:hypothetical protein